LIEEVKNDFIAERIQSQFSTEITWERPAPGTVVIKTEMDEDTSQPLTEWLEENGNVSLVKHMPGPGSCVYSVNLLATKFELSDFN
jgi:hypothetical protein